MKIKKLKMFTVLTCILWMPSLWGSCECDGGTSDYNYDCDGDGVNDSCEPCLPCTDAEGNPSDYLYDTDGDGINDSCTDPCNGLPRVPASIGPLPPPNSNPSPIPYPNIQTGNIHLRYSRTSLDGERYYVYYADVSAQTLTNTQVSFSGGWSLLDNSTVVSNGCGNATGSSTTNVTTPPSIGGGVVSAVLSVASAATDGAASILLAGLSELAGLVPDATPQTLVISSQAGVADKYLVFGGYVINGYFSSGTVSTNVPIYRDEYTTGILSPYNYSSNNPLSTITVGSINGGKQITLSPRNLRNFASMGARNDTPCCMLNP